MENASVESRVLEVFHSLISVALVLNVLRNASQVLCAVACRVDYLLSLRKGEFKTQRSYNTIFELQKSYFTFFNDETLLWFCLICVRNR